jgi:hypothetical protein
MTLDVLAFEGHFVDHLAPVWRALPDGVRGDFLTLPSLVARAAHRGVVAIPTERPHHVVHYPAARHDGRPALVASYGDVKEGRRLGYGPFAFIEHGIGQSYGNRRNGSYAGGPDRVDNQLIMVPNETCAVVWRAAYPDALIRVVGCPRLDDLPEREGDRGRTVALSFHWPAPLSISGYAGTAVGDYLAAIPKLVERFDVIGHAHPKGDWPRQMRRHYERWGVEFVPEFDDVCRRADVYVCDNSSTIFEFAATGRPVVLLNARHWSRKGPELGLRFWEASSVGINVWPGDDLVDAVTYALADDTEQQVARDAALALVYQPLAGGAQVAARELTAWMRRLAFAA